MRFSRVTLSLLVPLVIPEITVTAFTTPSTFNNINIYTQPHRRIPIPLPLSTAVNGESTTTSSTTPNDDDEPDTTTPIRLSLCEKARTVTSVCTSGTLCTSSIFDGIEGAPFGSFVDYVLDDDGNPVLLMNEMSMHTANVLAKMKHFDDKQQQQQSLVTLFTQLTGSPTSSNRSRGQDVSRCSITGYIEEISPSAPDRDVVTMRYAISHAYADRVMDSPKFRFYRIRPKKIYFVGGFGVTASWVPVEDYADATPDILAREASDIVDKLNRNHGGDLELVGMHLLDIAESDLEDVVITGVDRLGVDIRVTRRLRRNKLVTDEFRLGFRIPVLSVEDAKSEILKIFQDAWEKGEGYTWGDGDLPGSDVPIVKIAEDSLG